MMKPLVHQHSQEQQTALHIASRLGNVDIVSILLQHSASVDAVTKDSYTALHIAAKEGQEEVASLLLDASAKLTATTKVIVLPTIQLLLSRVSALSLT